MGYSCFKWRFTKTKFPFVLFPKYAAQLLDYLITVFSPPLKAKSTMDESLWGSSEHNVEKAYVPEDFTRFFYLCCLKIKWWGQNFVRTKFLMKLLDLTVCRLKVIGKKFRNLFCKTYFRCNGETCTCWILTHFKKPVHDRQCFFLCLCI